MNKIPDDFTRMHGYSEHNERASGNLKMVAGLVAIAILAAVLLLTIDVSLRLSPPASNTSHLTMPMPATEPTEKHHLDAVMEVANWFNCPCGGCKDDPLVNCSCDMSRGSVEVKQFIQNQLDLGKKRDKVIIAVQKRYGGLKPERQREFEKLTSEGAIATDPFPPQEVR